RDAQMAEKDRLTSQYERLRDLYLSPAAARANEGFAAYSAGDKRTGEQRLMSAVETRREILEDPKFADKVKTICPELLPKLIAKPAGQEKTERDDPLARPNYGLALLRAGTRMDPLELARLSEAASTANDPNFLRRPDAPVRPTPSAIDGPPVRPG